MPKILFICLGNVARSQMAEAFYNHFTKTRDATSAGILDFTPLKYPVLPDEVVTVMQEEGIDVSKGKVKTYTKEMIENAENIYVLCRKDECPAIIAESRKATFWSIEDPYGMGMDDIRKIRDQIKQKILSLTWDRKG